MKNALTLTSVIVALVCLPVAATADWIPNNPEDPLNSTNHKMHYPQLADPFGRDVNAKIPLMLADDWQCSETGQVSGIHFWSSSRDDAAFSIEDVHVGIYGNLDVGHPENPFPYSIPTAQPLWERHFGQGEFVLTPPIPTFMQGWYDPSTGQDIWPDHSNYYQVNIADIQDPLFIQHEGQVYWLALSLTVAGPTGGQPEVGWTTSSVTPFMDRPVFRDLTVPGMVWTPAWGVPGESATGPDLAFVITPEPGTVVMLIGAGLLGLLVCARHRRRVR
jgi:hypothetical protein